ncbi:hypothetical protein EB796_020429 [Bugula neritina]|uniref:Uncharacterized protein n=1 Tax=Bugula neritina TaxID=10212 RepID=A0A7J7J586_BUGNE|nr:hypothetical protein EB796_020429 [Bugula neritina]
MACKICFQFNCEECHRQKERCENINSLATAEKNAYKKMDSRREVQKDETGSKDQDREQKHQTKTNLTDVMKECHLFCQKEQLLIIQQHRDIYRKLKAKSDKNYTGESLPSEQRLRIGNIDSSTIGVPYGHF